MSRKHTEAEAVVARERKLLRQRLYQKRIRELTRKDHDYFWTDESQRWLVNLFQQNLPTTEIGRRMGITKNSVIGRLHRCGLSGGYCGPPPSMLARMVCEEWPQQTPLWT